MDIYILSRGTTHSQGFSWRKITEEGEEPAEPNIPPKFNNLIDPNKSFPSLSSLVLGRYKDKLILYITGLQAIDRKDSRQRDLYNSVVYIGQNSDDETVIQALIVKALQDELGDILNNVVKSRSDGSVEIFSNELQKLNSSAINGEILPIKTKRLGNLSTIRKQQLAEEITQLKHFPKKKDLLIVVTTIAEKKDLENAGVWRGLSDKITPDNETWEDSHQSEQPFINNFIELLKNSIQEFISQKTTLLLTGFLVFSLLINFVLIIKPSWNLNHEIDQLKIEYQQLQTNNQILKSENQVLEGQVKEKTNQFNNLKQTVEDLKKQRNQLQNQIDNYEKQIKNLEEKLEKLQKNLEKKQK